MEYRAIYSNSESLKHYGVLGMKWGVRRYQKKDGTLTAEGMRKYGRYGKERKKLIKEIQKSKSIFDDTERRKQKVAIRYQKERAKNALILDMVKEKGQTNWQKKMTQELMKKGYTKNDAIVTAYKKARNRKAMLAGAAIFAAAFGGYAGYNHWIHNMDYTISSGNSLLRAEKNHATNKLFDIFYATSSKTESKRFVSWLNQGKGVNQFKIFGNRPLKIAGDDTGAQMFKRYISSLSKSDNAYKEIDHLIKSDYYKSWANHHTTRFGLAGRDYKKAQAAWANGDYGNKSLYRLFNATFVGHTPSTKQSFMKFVERHGYDGVKDVNDRLYNGMNAKKAFIMVGGNSNKYSYTNKILSPEKANEITAAAQTQMMLPGVLKETGSSVAAALAVRKAMSPAARVAIYRKLHPNTKMTTAQILNYYERQDKLAETYR